MIEFGTVIGFDPDSGWPVVQLDDGATPACRPPKTRTITSSAGGTPSHTHTVTIEVDEGDEVGIIPVRGQASTEWAIVEVF